MTLVYLASVTTLVMLTNSFYVALHLSFIAQEIRDLHLYLDDWPHLSNYYRAYCSCCVIYSAHLQCVITTSVMY